MNKISLTMALFIGRASLARADSAMPQVGERFVHARARLYEAGWRAVPGAHASSGEYMGLDRSLVQNGYPESITAVLGSLFVPCNTSREKHACAYIHKENKSTR